MLLRLKVAWREFVHEVKNPTQRLVFAGFTFGFGLIGGAIILIAVLIGGLWSIFLSALAVSLFVVGYLLAIFCSYL